MRPANETPWSRTPGEEPIPGYRLLEPLGRGGFGEVWKCEAPGGLFKAIKFVNPGEEGCSPALQEQRALERIKTVRHPFILSLDRVEVIDRVLLIIMELADQSLQSVLADYQAEGSPGIPREQLLHFLVEAAEALDWLNFEHRLQHLDIKPHNLFVVSHHVKVADFGLVDLIDGPPPTPPPQNEPPGITSIPAPSPSLRQALSPQRGITPLYAAPELCRGAVSHHTDQYSLAIVYQQLLTGMVPFWSPNPYHLLQLHLLAEPNLVALPAGDRAVVSRALAKDPDRRFASCLEFIRELQGAPSKRSGSAVVRVTPARPLALPVPDTSTQEVRRPNPPEGWPVAAATVQVESPTPSEQIHIDTQILSEGQNQSRSRAEGDSRSVVAGPGRPSAAQPTCVILPGHRFVECVSHTPLADLWRVIDPDGLERRALSLSPLVCADPGLSSRLQLLLHPALPPTEVLYTPEGRLVLITDLQDLPLRKQFEERRSEGHVGIPRDELLGYLRDAAEVLDLLAVHTQVYHLGLNPGNLFVKKGKLQVADFGVVALAWVASGMPAGQLNPRYAAPELATCCSSASADQFALALIYAEMLTGFPPRSLRSFASSCLNRCVSGAEQKSGEQPALRGPLGRSGAHRVVRARFDLDLLPASDRAILARALDNDPHRRYPSCVDVIAALEEAGPARAKAKALYHRLPPVIPFTSLQGEPIPRGIVLPTSRQLVSLVTGIDTLPLLPAEPALPAGEKNDPAEGLAGEPDCEWEEIPILVRVDGLWEYRFPVQSPLRGGPLPGFAARIEGFRQHWNARILQAQDNATRLHIDFNLPRALCESPPEHPPGVELSLELPAVLPAPCTSEVCVLLCPVGTKEEMASQAFQQLLREVLHSLRLFLLANPEQRTEFRRTFLMNLHVYPVLPDLELDEVLEGVGIDISPVGIGFSTIHPVPTEKVYLHWPDAVQGKDFALLARVVRTQKHKDHYVVGAFFPGSRSNT
jgi:serine/threonine protein kinase